MKHWLIIKLAFLAMLLIQGTWAEYPVPGQMTPDDIFGPVYKVSPNGTVIVEAENLIGSNYGTEWKVSTTKGYYKNNKPGEGPTGGKFVVATKNRQGHDNKTINLPSKLVPDSKGWLIIKFYVPENMTGKYTSVSRHSQQKVDGDNDVFPVVIGKGNKISRNGFGSPGRFGFKWGFGTIQCKTPGVYAMGLIARSAGYAVDRMAIYHEGKIDKKAVVKLDAETAKLYNPSNLKPAFKAAVLKSTIKNFNIIGQSLPPLKNDHYSSLHIAIKK